MTDPQPEPTPEPTPEPFGPLFTYGTHEVLPGGLTVYAVTVRHVAAPPPIPDGKDDPPRPDPIRRPVGLVWDTGSAGWCASPPAASWSEAVDRAQRSFRDRDGAAMFLYGFDAALRWQKGQEAVARLPWRRNAPRL